MEVRAKHIPRSRLAAKREIPPTSDKLPDNSNAMRAATLKSRMAEIEVLSPFPRPRVSNDNMYSEGISHTVKYRPDYPRQPFISEDQADQWVALFIR